MGEWMPDDVESDLPFPSAGLNVAAGLPYQPAGTTPAAVNVRSGAPAGGRLRGGQRAGLSKYNPAIPGGSPSLIQHLNVIVAVPPDGSGSPGYYPDPDTGAMGGGTSGPEPGNPGEPDPSTNNYYFDQGGDPIIDPADPNVRNPYRIVRFGGSAVQLLRHRAGFHVAEANLFVGVKLSGSGTTYSLRLDTGETVTAEFLNADADATVPDDAKALVIQVGNDFYFELNTWGD